MTKTIKEQVQFNLGIRFYSPEDAIYLFESNYNKIIEEALRLFAKEIENLEYGEKQYFMQIKKKEYIELKKREGIEDG